MQPTRDRPALGGFLDLIEDGVSGRLVQDRASPTWPQALADAIVDAARDRDALRTMGLAGARRARERFAPSVCAAATTALYRTLVPAHD
jgi:glycosyltransferase involved in cell wall biosynthesis